MKPKILLPALFLLAACAPHLQTEAAAPPHAATKGAEAPKNTVPISEMDPGFLYLAAQNALNDGNPGLAVRLLEALVAKDPDAIQPRIQLAELLLGHGKYDEAGKILRDLADRHDLTDEERDTATMLRVRQLAMTGNPEDALNTLQPYLAGHPTDPDALRLQVQLLLSTGRKQEAGKAIDKAIRTGDSAELRLLQAQLMLQSSNFAGAKRALRQMRKLAPNDDTPVLMESQIALQQKQPDVAETKLRDFLDSHPDDLRIINALGRLLVRQGRMDEAVGVYQDLVNRTGGEPEVVKALGLLYLQQRDFRHAEATFARIEGYNDETTFFHAVSLDGLERTAEARKLYESIGKDSRQYADAQIRIAGIDARDGHFDASTRRLLQIIHDHPRKLEAYELLAGILLQQKRYDQLLSETEPALTLQHVPTGLLFDRAVAFNALKQHDREEESLHRLLAIDPNHADALNFLGYSLAERGVRLDEAEKYVNRALALKPDDAYYMDSLAWVYYRQGKYRQAARVQKKATEIVQDDATMLEHLGDIYWRLKQPDDARAAWRKALANKPENPGVLRKKLKQGL